eukprot:5647963-Pyramimonas_sp.AAC.1
MQYVLVATINITAATPVTTATDIATSVRTSILVVATTCTFLLAESMSLTLRTRTQLTPHTDQASCW